MQVIELKGEKSSDGLKRPDFASKEIPFKLAKRVKLSMNCGIFLFFFSSKHIKLL